MKFNVHQSIQTIECKRVIALFIIFLLSSFTLRLNALEIRVSEPALKLTLSEKYIDDDVVRPFITDDARVVGGKLGQMESWGRLDKESYQQWALFAYGPTEWLELTFGGVFGWDIEDQHFSYALPLLQAKFLFKGYKPNELPGFGASVGTFLPVGSGAFKPPGYGAFGYITVSQCLGDGEQFLFHANIGASYLFIDGSNTLIPTWGVGTQIRLGSGLHFVGEVFSGDPYIPGVGLSYQVGCRYFVSDILQIDATIGNGITGIPTPLPLWGSAGVRIVFDKLFGNGEK